MMTNKRWIMAVLAMLVLPAMACSFSFDLAGETPGPPTATPLGPGPAGPSFSNVFFAAGVTASNEPVDVATDFPQGATMVYAFASYGGMADGAQCQSLWYLGGEEAARTDFEWNMGESGTTWIANLENEDGLQSGRYEWELLVEGELVASGGFGIAAPTGVLFEDDFTDVGSGWEVGDYDGAGVGYKNGIYFVISVGDGKNMWGVANRSFSDLAIEVDATQVSAPASNDNA